MQTLCAGCSKVEPKISPHRSPLILTESVLAVIRRRKNFALLQTPSRGCRMAKIYQLETVTTFTYRPSLMKIDARNFKLSW